MTTVGKLVGDSHEDEAVQITRSSSNQTQLARSIHMQALLLCQSINQSINTDYSLQMHNWMLSCWLLFAGDLQIP